MKKFWRLFLVLSFVMAPAAGYAADNGVGVGDNIPHDLKVSDQNGERLGFDSLSGERGAVLVFVRSADWCPYCQAQLLDLQQKGEAIDNAGYSIVAISYDSVEKLAAFSKKYDFKYRILSDPGSEIIKAFGILNEDVDPDSFYYGIPHPTIFVVSNGGVIQARLAEEGYKERPPVSDILSIIQKK